MTRPRRTEVTRRAKDAQYIANEMQRTLNALREHDELPERNSDGSASQAERWYIRMSIRAHRVAAFLLALDGRVKPRKEKAPHTPGLYVVNFVKKKPRKTAGKKRGKR